MQKILIPLFACLLGMVSQLSAQVPESISILQSTDPQAIKFNSPDQACLNNAGTFQLGQFIGQSNDTSLDTLFFCFGDSIFINHNGDFSLADDPVPGTPGGIGWAFYDCPPTISGMDLATVVTDPCVVPGGPNGIWVYTGQQGGDAWFFNNGTLQNLFNAGQPLQLFFAPITLDILDTSVQPSVQGFESSQVGFPPGPCVHVNTAEAFSVVYLNEVLESGVSTNFGNDCLGKFRIEGGYPEFNTSALYTITITLAGNPNVKALIHTAKEQMFHGADIIFSVPQAGTYNVTVEDGKSCGRSFQINMSGCNPVDNVVLSWPEIVAPPGSQICVPLTVENYNSVSASFSMSWDPTVLQYTGFANADTSIGGFGPANFNINQTANGLLGVIIYDDVVTGQVISIPDGQTIFEICFTVTDSLGLCSPLNITNSPTSVAIEDEFGQALAITVDTGQVCAGYLPLAMDIDIDTMCLGTATITVCPEGGVAPYEIYITSAGGPTYNAILPNIGDCFTTPATTGGVFVITVIDSNSDTISPGDTITQTITIVLESLGAALDLTQLPSCSGSMDGEVTVTVFMGTTAVPNPGPPQYTFTWNVPGAPDAPILTGVGAGNIAVTVTDNSTGCSATASGTLGQPAPLSEQSIIVQDASCTGVCDGTIFYAMEGGVPLTSGPGGYLYNWTYSPDFNPANTFQDEAGQGNPIVLMDKCAGLYYLTVTDANGCTHTDSLEVNNIREINIVQVSLADISCNGANDGEICVEATETPAAAGQTYLFFWQPQGFSQVGTDTTSCYSGLGAGNYDLLAIDANGCVASSSFEITEPTPVTVTTTSVQHPGCGTLQNNGRIQLFATGGVGGPNTYTYAWDDGGTGSLRDGLSEGTYCATVSDPNGCTDTICVTLTLPPPPTITAIDSVSVQCGNDGCLTVTTNPVGASYVWTLLDGTPLQTGPDAQICDLNGGTYAVTITDAMGCSVSDTLSLGTVEVMTISDTSFIAPSCFGTADGVINVGISGGQGPYTYLWTPTGQTGASLIDAAGGFYTLQVTDAQDCVFSTELELVGPPEIKVDFPQASISPTTCYENCDGSATPVVYFDTAPQTSGNFNFVWEDGSTDSVSITLCAGINGVTISDANNPNCFIVSEVQIGSPEPVIASLITIDSVNCFGAADGTIIVSPGGGNGGPFTYQWSANAGGATTGTVTGLAAGTYVVTITDGSQCTGDTTIVLGEPGEILISEDPGTTDPECFGGSDGSVAVEVTGGTEPYSYVWSDGNQQIGITNPQDNLPAGQYLVTVTDFNGCTNTFQLQLSEPPPVQGSYDALEPLLCNGDETVLTVDTIFGGSGGPYQYSLDFGVTLDPGFPISIGGGEHYITYFSGDCSITDTIQVFEPAPIEVTFDPVNIEIELGDTTLILNPIVTGAVVDSFLWSPAEYLFNPNSFTPTVNTFESQTFMLTVYDENGCVGVGSVVVNVDPNRNVYIPNIFKPGNSAGLNDHFAPWIGRGVEIVNYMRVYDRWGEQLYGRDSFFPENQPADGWDGRYRGDWVLPGVYVYVIEVKFLDGRVLLYRGDVTVVR